MLHDRNAGAEQQRVGGPRTVRRVVDVERVDADQRGARRDQLLRRRAGQERMAGAVPLGAPVDVPSRVHEHGLAPHLPPAKRLDIERATVALGDADDHALQIGDRVE